MNTAMSTTQSKMHTVTVNRARKKSKMTSYNVYTINANAHAATPQTHTHMHTHATQNDVTTSISSFAIVRSKWCMFAQSKEIQMITNQ